MTDKPKQIVKTSKPKFQPPKPNFSQKFNNANTRKPTNIRPQGRGR